MSVYTIDFERKHMTIDRDTRELQFGSPEFTYHFKIPRPSALTHASKRLVLVGTYPNGVDGLVVVQNQMVVGVDPAGNVGMVSFVLSDRHRMRCGTSVIRNIDGFLKAIQAKVDWYANRRA